MSTFWRFIQIMYRRFSERLFCNAKSNIVVQESISCRKRKMGFLMLDHWTHNLSCIHRMVWFFSKSFVPYDTAFFQNNLDRWVLWTALFSFSLLLRVNSSIPWARFEKASAPNIDFLRNGITVKSKASILWSQQFCLRDNDSCFSFYLNW